MPIAEFRAALRLKPDLAVAHDSLGRALLVQGKLDEAVAECPGSDSAQARRICVSQQPWAAVLAKRGELDDAIAETREALRLKPDDAVPTLTSALPSEAREARGGDHRIPRGPAAQAQPSRSPQQPRQRLTRPGEARRGDRRVPRSAPAQARRSQTPTLMLGIALASQGKLDEAIAEYREALRLKPDDLEPTATSASP